MSNSNRIILFICLIAFPFISQAQIFNPIQWKTETMKISADEYEIRLTADIEKGWRLYGGSQLDDGPIVFAYEINETINATTIGELKSVEEAIIYKDPLFGMDVQAYTDSVTFTMTVRLNDTSQDGEIRLAFEFMTCNDTRCLVPKHLETNFILKKE